MSSIVLKGKKMEQAIEKIASVKQNMEEVAESLRSLGSYRYMVGKDFQPIYMTLDKVIDKIREDQSDVGALETALTSIVNLYQTAEQNICNEIDPSSASKESASGGAEQSGEAPEWLDNIWDIISNGGPAGTFISLIGSVISGGIMPGWNDIIGMTSDYLDVIGSLISLVDETEVDWLEELFDHVDFMDKLDLAADASAGDAAEAVFREFFDDLTFKTTFDAADATKHVGEAVSTVANWLGIVASLADNAFDNVDEYNTGEIGAGRAAAETILETVTDVGLDILAGMGVAAGAVALGVSAPAWAIGAVATVAVIGVNWGVEALSGKDIGEWAADVVCDAGEAIADWFGSLFG